MQQKASYQSLFRRSIHGRESYSPYPRILRCSNQNLMKNSPNRSLTCIPVSWSYLVLVPGASTRTNERIVNSWNSGFSLSSLKAQVRKLIHWLLLYLLNLIPDTCNLWNSLNWTFRLVTKNGFNEKIRRQNTDLSFGSLIYIIIMF